MYVGKTYSIPLEKTGLCHSKNIDTMKPYSMVHPSRNILLNEGGIRKRGGTVPVDTNIMYNIGAAVFDGAGLDDMSAGTAFAHTAALVFTVQIDATGTPDTFKWMRTGGDWTTGVAITGAEQALEYSFKITFAATTGHTLNDKWTVAITAPEVTGLFDFRLVNGNQKIVRTTNAGKIWKTNAVTIKTGWTADKLASIVQAEDVIYICNGADLPVTWNGTDAAVTNFANVPTDWTGTNYPSQMILHGRGNSLRNWALGCPSTPKTIYVSANGALDDFTQATVLTFYIETGDGNGIVGGMEFGDRLIVFGKKRSFILDDADTDTANWGYQASQWEGGASNQRLIVRTPNDIVCMMGNGEIYSVTGAEQYGDYKAASLSRPSFIHEWIKTYVNLSMISKFHAVYDPVLRAVKVFAVRTGESNIDTALVYFVDRPLESAWTILQNTDYESGYSARCAGLVRQGAGDWKVYTGGYAGKVWKLGEVNRNDNGSAFTTRCKLPNTAFDNARESKRYDYIKIIALSEGSCDVTITWWLDGVEVGSKTINPDRGDMLGTFALGVGELGGMNILETSVKIGAIGKRIQVEAKSDTANEDFFLSQLLIDYVPLGKRV